MNYGALIETIKPDVLAAMQLINNPEIAPDVRQINQEILLREVGQTIYSKVYDMNAFDMNIEHTIGKGIDDRFYGMAKVAANSPSTGALGLEEYVTNYLQSMAGKAQEDAFTTAKQSNKRPKVDRSESGKACDWCKSMVKLASQPDPPPEAFHRHGGCGGKIITSGYKTRNGELKNYKKGTKTTVYRSTGDVIDSGSDLFGEAHYVYRDKSQAAKGGNVVSESLTISPKQIYTIKSDAQYEALVNDAIRTYKGLDVQQAIPKLMKKRGFKAIEGTPEYDPLAGLAIYDPKIIKKL